MSGDRSDIVGRWHAECRFAVRAAFLVIAFIAFQAFVNEVHWILLPCLAAILTVLGTLALTYRHTFQIMVLERSVAEDSCQNSSATPDEDGETKVADIGPILKERERKRSRQL